jgi:hypothetical protein
MIKTMQRAIGVGLLCAAAAQASTTHIDFNSDPVAAGLVTSIAGTVAQWVPTDGLAYDAVTNANDGYLQLTSAANSQTATIIFPDFDAGAVVQGFSFDCWVRIGNGTTTPADGFSISYSRSPLPSTILYNSSTPGNSDAEEGTRTGIAVGFDAYDNGTTPPDLRGLDIWVDGVQVAQFPMPNLNGTVTDPTSLQTGPNDGTGNPDILGWAHCVVTLSTNGVLNVFYKDTQVLTNFASGFVPGPGQLVLAGRTGGLNQNQDVDQITITTTVAQNVLAGPATGIGDGVSVTFYDSGSGVVDTTKSATVSIDGAAAVPASAVVKNGTTTSVIYYGYPTLFVAGSVHHVVATVTDTFGRVTTTGSLQFTVGAFSTVPAVAVTGVDTSKVGFLIKPWQSGIEPNNPWWADEQLAGLHGAINPLCDLTSATNNGYFNYSGVINFNYTNANTQAFNENGNFQVSNGYEESQLPGIVTDPNISGTPANTNVDNSSLEVLCYLHFPSGGVYEMGVNSDDGFDVTVGTNPEDWGALSLGAFGLPANGYNAGRGASDTTFSFIIPAAGYYPFRLVWENGTGGANLEWFVVQPGGNKVLLNDLDPTNTTGITAYYGGPALPAYVSQLVPNPDTTTPAANALSARLTDRGTTVSASPITLSLDGTPVSGAVISQGGGITTISAPPGFLMSVAAHTAQLVYSTSAGGPFTNTWKFTVSSFLLSSWAVPASSVDTTKPGFRIMPYQSHYWPSSSGAQNNTVQYTLEQLAGLHGLNSADLTTATDAGAIDYTNVINFDLNGANNGDFQAGAGYPDGPFPGLDLNGTPPIANIGNQSIDVRVFLRFATAGVYTMGVNSDDGFAVYAGANPADLTTSALLGSFNAGRGASDTIFSFLVLTPGIYPFRMIWENGDGAGPGNGANCEWFSVLANGTKILLNDPDPTNTTGVTAFYAGPALPAYISALCPAPGATGVSPLHAAAGLSLNTFGVQLTDGSTTVTPASIEVFINGTAMTPTVSPKVSGVTTVTLPGFLPAGTNFAQFVYSTSGGGPFTNTWGFTAASNTLPILNGAWAVTGVNTANKGFKYRPWQSAGQANTVLWTEEQLAGLHGPNNADLSILNDGKYFDYLGVVNFDIGTSADGDFTTGRPAGYTDINFPGIPGANGVTDNSSFEILTWLQLSQVGVYTMCVNSDDGFKVTVGPNPADLFAKDLGDFNAGRGSGFDAGTAFSFIITNAGFYPFRLIWENGGGGCNCEWSIVQPNGDRILINDPAAPANTFVSAYYTGPAAPAGIEIVEPTPGATDGLGSMMVRLNDGSTSVTPGSITLTINGVVVTPTIVQANGITTITLDGLTAGVQTNTLVYSTSAGHFTNTWTFTETVSSTTPIDGITLSTNLWTPPGSGSNPGFALKVYQAPNTNIFNGWQTIARMADMALHGLYEVNVADLTEFTNNGVLWLTNGVINYASNDPTPATPPGAGNFQASTFPDALFPGLGLYTPPNSTYFTNGTTTMNYSAMEVKAFLEFASPGYYVMGVNSDDGFRLTEGDQGAPGKSPLFVLAPASAAGEMTAMYTSQADEGGNIGFGGNPPSTTPIIGRVVLANPIDASTALVNASALSGNIAFIQRGVVGFAVKAKAAQDAGAVAVIIANNAANDAGNEFPGTMGGADATVTIPCLFVNYQNGTNLIAMGTTDTSSPIIARITAQDCSPILGKIDETKGSSDVLFGITVPAAGVYPFRLIWDNGNGGCNLEWFVRDLVLGTYLVNQPGSPVKAWITRNVNYVGALPAPRLNDAYVSGGNVVISWTGQGELWEAYSIHGPWFKSTYQANPSAVVLNPFLPVRYFRVRQY